jgi:hypothetical protein
MPPLSAPIPTVLLRAGFTRDTTRDRGDSDRFRQSTAGFLRKTSAASARASGGKKERIKGRRLSSSLVAFRD